jgi:hypothetical protein
VPTQLARAVVVLLAALACVATSAPRFPRNYATWRVFSESTRELGCARAEAWVAKSGKQGVGLTIAITVPEGCTQVITITSAELQVGREVVPRAEAPPPRPGAGGATYHYLAFPFDNNRAWNAGVHDARLELVLAVDGAPLAWSLSLHQERNGPHRERRYGAPP